MLWLIPCLVRAPSFSVLMAWIHADAAEESAERLERRRSGAGVLRHGQPARALLCGGSPTVGCGGA